MMNPTPGTLMLALLVLAAGCAPGRPSTEAARHPAPGAQAESDAHRAQRLQQEAVAVQAMSARRQIELANAQNRLENQEDRADLDARPPAARRAKEALDRLSPFAAVKDGPHGAVVVGLDDSVLFQGDSAELMPTARDRLDRVAQALYEVKARSVIVRGHMDRSGDERRDLELSRRRANAVCAYLASRGVAPDRIRAEGVGTAEPKSSNASAEGKSQNRRVEIVVDTVRQPSSKP